MLFISVNPVLCRGAVVAAMAWLAPGAWAQQAVYRCPGNNFTNALTPKEAEQRGCKALEGNVTVVSGTKPQGSRPVAASVTPSASGGERVASGEQRARDSDARRILETELKSEETRLASLKQEYNNGEPERRGDERNYQKYLDRVAALQASISRKENDIAALRRELDKLPR